MRSSMPHFFSRCFVFLFLVASVQRGNGQLHPDRAKIRDGGGVQLQVRKDELTVTIPWDRSVEPSMPFNVRLTLLSPEGVARAEAFERVQLGRRDKQFMVRLAKPFEKVPVSEMEDLHWLRLTYEVTAASGEVLRSGIEALRTETTDPFVLTAAGSRVAAAGRPYRVQVHVKGSNEAAIAGAEAQGDLTWDDDNGGDKKITAMATTNGAGNATLEFSIPREVPAESGDLTVSLKSGLVAHSVERSVEFHTPSYLLLDTDKDIYQPGQTLHTRMLRFDSERKAVNNDTLDVRIDDEENTLVFKQTVATDAFGVAHLDWQIPTNLRQGSYAIRVAPSGQDENGRRARADKSIRIYRYDLPNYRVSAHPDKTYYLPGQNADITVSAEYLFGKPVTRGKVRVVEENDRKWNYRKQQWESKEGQVKTGELDHDGRFTAHFDLTKGHDDLKDDNYRQFQDVNLAAYVTDLTTGRTEQRRFDVRVTKNPIHVYLNSNPTRSRGFPNTFFLSTFYADGTPARCKVQLSLTDDGDDEKPKLPLRVVQTNKYGLAKVTELTIPEDEDRNSLVAEARDARGLQGRETERVNSSDEDFGVVEVTAAHTIYKPGDPLEVTLRSSRPALRLTVQAIREGVVLASQQVRLRNGRGYAAFPYDSRFTDEITVLAFSLEQEWSSYVLLEGARTVLYPKNRQLDIAIQFDKNEHRPGEDASARFAVRSAEKTATETALGLKLVDRAVEERAQTDSDFGQRTGGWWWPWSLWSSNMNSSFGGVSRDDLDHVDLTQPIAPDLDLVAELILQSSNSDFLEMLQSESPLAAETVFSKILTQQFQPLETGLGRWNEQGKLPNNLDDLEVIGKEEGIDVRGLRDPWGTPYRYELTFQGTEQVLTVTSAGPDKRFGTKDDFTAHRTTRSYFRHYGKLIESVTRDYAEREGKFLRDFDTLQAELLKRGVDFKALRDPWGRPYDVQFLVSGSYYVTQIMAHLGGTDSSKIGAGFSVWQDRVDYFVKSRENINKVLTAHLNAGGRYPSNEEGFKDILRKAGVDLNELRDPWGHAYYAVLMRVAQYGDRVSIQRTSSSGEQTSEPTTLVRQDVRVMSAGPDGKEGTADDFQTAGYSILVSEQSSKNASPQPAPPGMSLVVNTGAIAGVVQDSSGAVIPNATVEALREQTSETYATKTNDMGRFELKDLAPGVYDIKAYAAGFRALAVNAVLVQAANVTEFSFELSVGASTETVEVTAEAQRIETSSASLAISPRNVSQLAQLAPGVSQPAKSGALSTPRLRQDFPETMLWEPALITDRRGRAKLNFKLADNITTWKLTAVGSTKTGELGRAEKDLRAFQPFFVEHDPPRILTQGDEISYPLVLRNYLDRAQTLKASIKPESWFTMLGPAEIPVKVEAGDSAHAVFQYRAVAAVIDGKQQVSAANSEISDAAQKPVDVHPLGRPLSVTAAGVVGRTGFLALKIPENGIAGSLQARIKIYPNLLAHVVENLEAGLEKPHGCGEQTISSTYPSLLVAGIYAKSGQKSPIASKAQRYLEAGYERLLRYQSESGGFSYWGHGEAPDLALTTYALEFLDHAGNLIAVDDGVVQSAERWVLQQQATDGSWRGHWDKNDRDALSLTAYIAETLAQLARKDAAKSNLRGASLERALSFLAAHHDLADEPYEIASYALAAKATGKQQVFADLIDSLRKSAHEQQGASYWKLERNTPFYGWGHTGELESTALVLRALAADTSQPESDRSLIRKGLLFLLRNEDKDGMWDSGQTTVHVLKTLLSMVAQRLETGGKLTIRVNGKEAKLVELPVGETIAAPVEVNVSAWMLPGENRVDLESSGEGMMSAQFVADLYVPWEESSVIASKQQPNATSVLRFAVEYSKTKATAGEVVECHVRAERLGYRGYGMMLGEAGLPPGVDVDRESLERAMQGNDAVYRYDVLPDRVILYLWPEAGGSAFTFRFRPRFAMQAETAPSLLYDYYNPEASVIVKPTRFEISPGKED